MKKTHLTAATAGAALILLASQPVLAYHSTGNVLAYTEQLPAAPPTGPDDPVPGNPKYPAPDASSATPTPGPIVPTVGHIKSVDLNQAANGAAGTKLSDDSSYKTVLLLHQNGKPVVKTLVDGKLESEKELGSSDSVTVQGLDAMAKPRSITIKPDGDQFKIIDLSSAITTKLPLFVDPRSNRIFVVTSAGRIELRVLPVKAFDIIKSYHLLDKVDSSTIEVEHGSTTAPSTISDNPMPAEAGVNAVVRAKGIKHVKFLGLFPINAHQTTVVNIVSGIGKIETKPWYLNVFALLYSGK